MGGGRDPNCYTQGNFGKQQEAFELAVNALNDVHYLSQQQLDIQTLKNYVGNDTALYDVLDIVKYVIL